MTRRRYTVPGAPDEDAPTKAQHDARVEATGRPYTQPDWDKLPEHPDDIPQPITD